MSANKIAFGGVLLLAAVIAAINGMLTSDVKACKPGDEECLIETINYVMANKYQGDDELNLMTFDPLKVDHLGIERSPTNPLNADITLQNSEIFGYKELRAIQVNGFGSSPEGNHEIYFHGPYASLIGDYSIDGEVATQPIKGQGRTNLTLEDVFVKIVVVGGSKVIDDATYMDVKEVQMDFNTTRLYTDFANLFDGNKILGDNINKYLNENWSGIFTELKNGFIGSITNVVTDVVRNVLTAHPYNVLLDFGN